MNRRPPKNGKIELKLNTLLIDGNALFKTGYHGAKNEYNGKGQHIGGLYQFITILRKLLTENLYHRVFVFWDGKLSGKMRYEIYSDYKSERGKNYIDGTEPEDKDLLIQQFMVQEYLEELFIRQIKHEIVESDDFIAYFCKTKKDYEKITIVTNDRDLCQLINEDVQIYLCDKKSYVTHYNYQQYFNHHISNAVLVKMISGDASDSIKGVKGVKETTLLKYFPEIGERPVSLDEIITKAKALQEERITQKKKPLQVFDNLINGITDGIQGDRLYEINRTLVDLSIPMITEEAIIELDELRGNPVDPEDRGVKNAYVKMKRDGIDKKVGGDGIEYLLPFKRLIEREKKHFINQNIEHGEEN